MIALSPLQALMAARKPLASTPVKPIVYEPIRSPITAPSTLADFLKIYFSSNRQMYLNYMAGAKVLYSYLKPIAISPYDYLPHIPSILRTYEITKLAEILTEYDTSSKKDIAIALAQVRNAEKAIMEYLLQ